MLYSLVCLTALYDKCVHVNLMFQNVLPLDAAITSLKEE